LLRHELIGLRARVTNARNQLNLGIKGKVVDETNHTLVIESKKAEKRLFKKTVTLEFTLPDKTKTTILGSEIEGRPWDRIKKKT